MGMSEHATSFQDAARAIDSGLGVRIRQAAHRRAIALIDEIQDIHPAAPPRIASHEVGADLFVAAAAEEDGLPDLTRLAARQPLHLADARVRAHGCKLHVRGVQRRANVIGLALSDRHRSWRRQSADAKEREKGAPQ
jgi:hypothetical protein